MRRPNLLVTVRNFLFGLFFAWLVLSPVPKNSSQMDSVGIGVQTISTIRAGSREEPTQNLAKKKFFREMLKQYFPDWNVRVNYQNKQVKFYRSGLRRISEAKRLRIKLKLTPQEQDAFDYFGGKNFYSYHQNVKTSPNIYDTRQSFLLKMENREMRAKFLKAYNRNKIRLEAETNS